MQSRLRNFRYDKMKFFNDLPSDCLIAVFSRLPTGCLYRSRRVCVRWYLVITQNVTPSRTALSLLTFIDQTRFMVFNLSHAEARFYNVNHFDLVVRCTKWADKTAHTTTRSRFRKGARPRVLDHLDEATCAELVRLFPRLTHLTVVDTCSLRAYLSERNLARMLTAWKDTLVSVTIVGHYESNEIFAALEQLANMKVLTTNAHLNRLATVLYQRPLDELYCWGLDPRIPIPADLSHWLCNVRSWNLYMHPDSYQYSPALDGAASHNELRKLTRFDFGYLDIRNLEVMTYRWTWLTTARLSIWNGQLDAAFVSLQRLVCLTDLTLGVEPFNAHRHRFRYLAPLTTVKSVRLIFSIHPHECHHVQAIFPNARQVSFRVCSYWYYRALLCRSGQACVNCVFIRKAIHRHDLADVNLYFELKVNNDNNSRGAISGYKVEKFDYDWILDLVQW